MINGQGQQALGLSGMMNQAAQGQWGAYRGLAQQQAAIPAAYLMGGISGLLSGSPAGHDGDYWETHEQRRLERAQRFAAEARARHPEMQVKRRTRTEDVCK